MTDVSGDGVKERPLARGRLDLPPASGEPAEAPGAVVVRVSAEYLPKGAIEVVAHRRVVVVDDDDDYRETLRALLMGRGYELHAAADGARGMKLVSELKPDLVITDFNMPRMNGYELVSKLRGDPATSGIPMILFTGSANRRQLQGLHIDRCLMLEKPIRNEVLFDAVADFIGNAWPAPPPRAPGAPPPPPPPPPRPARDEDAAAALEDVASLQLEEAEPEPESTSLDVETSDSPTIALVHKLLAQAVRAGASDIHFECEPDRVAVRFRVDGSMRQAATLPGSIRSRIAVRLKIMAKLVITERRLPQDGQIRALVDGVSVDFRVSVVAGQHGENVVLRVMAGAAVKTDLPQLGLKPRDLQAAQRALSGASGLVLVTGPTGSGKTTTLYTMLQGLCTPENKILTAEDPVERTLAGATQVAIRADIGLTFEKVLRSFLRQDPDIILIGEIRDVETAEIAIKAAITGHLVLSTLHTSSAAATIVRLTQMGVPAYLLASSLRLVVAQRLVRALCPNCLQLADASTLDLALLTEAEASRIRKSWVAAGCEACHWTGYRGRLPLFEVMPVASADLRRAILDGEGDDSLARLAVAEGMTTLRESALDAVAAGRTSVAEALAFIVGE